MSKFAELKCAACISKATCVHRCFGMYPKSIVFCLQLDSILTEAKTLKINQRAFFLAAVVLEKDTF